MPIRTGLSQTDLGHVYTLSAHSVLELAVDGTELVAQDLLLLGQNFLNLADDLVQAVLDGDGGSGLVTTLGEDLGVVGGTTTVPSEELRWS